MSNPNPTTGSGVLTKADMVVVLTGSETELDAIVLGIDCTAEFISESDGISSGHRPLCILNRL